MLSMYITLESSVLIHGFSPILLGWSTCWVQSAGHEGGCIRRGGYRIKYSTTVFWSLEYTSGTRRHRMLHSRHLRIHEEIDFLNCLSDWNSKLFAFIIPTYQQGYTRILKDDHRSHDAIEFPTLWELLQYFFHPLSPSFFQLGWIWIEWSWRRPAKRDKLPWSSYVSYMQKTFRSEPLPRISCLEFPYRWMCPSERTPSYCTQLVAQVLRSQRWFRASRNQTLDHWRKLNWKYTSSYRSIDSSIQFDFYVLKYCFLLLNALG